MLRFGMDKLNQVGQIDVLMRELPAVRPTTAERLSLIAYQTDYGIFDHSSPAARSRPLAMVGVHPKEDTVEGGPIRSHIRRFFNYRIGKHFDLSLKEFFDLEVPVVHFLYEMAESRMANGDSAERELARQLDLDLDR